jgi:hypothetical protein
MTTNKLPREVLGVRVPDSKLGAAAIEQRGSGLGRQHD